MIFFINALNGAAAGVGGKQGSSSLPGPRRCSGAQSDQRGDCSGSSACPAAGLAPGKPISDSGSSCLAILRIACCARESDPKFATDSAGRKNRGAIQQLAEQEIYPSLGKIKLQKLKLATVEDWHCTLLRTGGKNGRPLSPRTTGHAHRILQRALQRAVETEVLASNVAGILGAPASPDTDVEILARSRCRWCSATLSGMPST